MNKSKQAYRVYLGSDHWKRLREQVLKRDGGRCVRCGRICHLQAHHRFYREGWEQSEVGDLITLCRWCHELEHGLGEIGSGVGGWTRKGLDAARSQGRVDREEYLRERALLPVFVKPRRFRKRKFRKRISYNTESRYH